MRTKVLLFLLANVLVLGLLVRSVWTLLALLVIDGSDAAISRAEIPAPNSDMIKQLPQIIPKIIHQTYVNDSIPEVWQEAQKSCLDLHKDYEYRV
jgi:mannosyltransferase OCH1-like enzyme